MHVGQRRETNNPAQLLESETGRFRVWGPAGQVEIYDCEPGRSIFSITHYNTASPRRNYLVEKIAGFRPRSTVRLRPSG